MKNVCECYGDGVCISESYYVADKYVQLHGAKLHQYDGDGAGRVPRAKRDFYPPRAPSAQSYLPTTASCAKESRTTTTKRRRRRRTTRSSLFSPPSPFHSTALGRCSFSPPFVAARRALVSSYTAYSPSSNLEYNATPRHCTERERVLTFKSRARLERVSEFYRALRIKVKGFFQKARRRNDLKLVNGYELDRSSVFPRPRARSQAHTHTPTTPCSPPPPSSPPPTTAHKTSANFCLFPAMYLRRGISGGDRYRKSCRGR